MCRLHPLPATVFPKFSLAPNGTRVVPEESIFEATVLAVERYLHTVDPCCACFAKLISHACFIDQSRNFGPSGPAARLAYPCGGLVFQLKLVCLVLRS